MGPQVVKTLSRLLKEVGSKLLKCDSRTLREAHRRNVLLEQFDTFGNYLGLPEETRSAWYGTSEWSGPDASFVDVLTTDLGFVMLGAAENAMFKVRPTHVATRGVTTPRPPPPSND